MATFAGSMEALHGHNYAVTIEVTGDLDDEDGWIVDFGLLKQLGRATCDRLDHHFLLQTRSTLLSACCADGMWTISYGDKRYLLPAEDVFELPVTNTTVEQIAEWFWQEIARSLRAQPVHTVRQLMIGIEEAPGQSGWFSADFKPA